MQNIKAKTLMQHTFETNREGIKDAYNAWAAGAVNIAREDKPIYYYAHFILSGIDYTEFLEIIQER